MKKILLSSICFLAYIFPTQAQTLYGTTFSGGNYGGGTINKFVPATNNLIVAKSFEKIGNNETGSSVSSGLIQASDGKLYGMTNEGGSTGSGVIFSFDPSSSTYTKLKDFDNINGGNPYGSLMQASDGKLYGMTTQGGSGDYGVIFSFDPSSSTYTKLVDFDDTNGARPFGSLMQASNGKLYGMTQNGGKSGYGVIFSFDPSSSTYTKLKDFDDKGGYPQASLIQASDGKLYGMVMSGGGSSDMGVIFSFDPSSSTYKKLKNFDDTNGAFPFGSLIQASDGKLYGMTSQGGSSNAGVIFSFDPSASTYKKLKDFDNTNGANPFGSLMQASDGKLYGMTSSGGSSFNGVIFSFNPSASIYTKLKDFDGTNGASPFSAFIEVNNSGILEAEKAVLHGAVVAGNHPGFTGSGFVDYQSASGDFIEWTANAPAAGSYWLKFRYSNGGAVNRPLKLNVNGSVVAARLAFSPTGGWATWAVSSATVSLIAGSNKIRLTAIGSSGPNLDHLIVEIIKVTLEAEKAVLHGAVVAANHPGYTGSGFVDYQNASGDFIEWTANAPAAGSYRLKFRYANGGTANRPLKLKVNGSVVAASLAFSPTGGWATWAVSSATVSLIAGTNKIRLTAIGSSGPNVDHVTIKIVEKTLEAEEAVLNGAVVAANHPGYTGSGFADYQNASGDFIEWTANAPAAGSYWLKFRYANGGAANRPLKLKVNGSVVAASLAFSPTNGWATWAVSSVTASLVAGSNKIRLTAIGSGGPNVDHLAFSNNSIQSVQRFVLTETESNISMVSNKPYSINNKTDINGSVSVKLAPNPANDILNIYTTGLQKDKQLIVSVISASGVIMKTKQLISSPQRVQLDVSSLVSGVYTIKVISSNKVMYKQFVKL